jgi:DNA gyrase subunit B
MSTESNRVYTAADIQVLNGLEAVRKRPGMYIGDTSDGWGLHHMVFEVVGAALDEARADGATRIDVTLHANGAVSVEDNGSGMPPSLYRDTGQSIPEYILTSLHVGGNVRISTPDEAVVARQWHGLNGVGVAVINGLSSTLNLTTWRDGYTYDISFREGVTQAPLWMSGSSLGRHGTRITFTPDPTIFATSAFDFAILETRLRELAFLNPGVEVVLVDERPPTPHAVTMHAANGLADYVRFLDRGWETLTANPIRMSGVHEGISVEAAFRWNRGYDATLLCFADHRLQQRGGTHRSGLLSALERQMERQGPVAPQDAISDGLCAVVSVAVPYPMTLRYAGCTLEKLVSPEVEVAVDCVVTEGLSRWFAANQTDGRVIIEKIAKNTRSRAAAKTFPF